LLAAAQTISWRWKHRGSDIIAALPTAGGGRVQRASAGRKDGEERDGCCPRIRSKAPHAVTIAWLGEAGWREEAGFSLVSRRELARRRAPGS
jgi:hypothetical protein